MKPTLETCLSPELLHQHNLPGKIVIIIDVLRATTCMVAAFIKKADHLLTFASMDECIEMRKEGYLLAGEREGIKIENFDLGNSPTEYLASDLEGKKIAITTTNGTMAIKSSEQCKERIIASFLNKTAVVNYCKSKNLPVILFCAGWKGKINLEDSLLAGAISAGLSDEFEFVDDSTKLVHSFYLANKFELTSVLSQAAHQHRLANSNQGKDLEICISEDLTRVIPIVKGKEIRV